MLPPRFVGQIPRLSPTYAAIASLNAAMPASPSRRATTIGKQPEPQVATAEVPQEEGHPHVAPVRGCFRTRELPCRSPENILWPMWSQGTERREVRENLILGGTELH